MIGFLKLTAGTGILVFCLYLIFSSDSVNGEKVFTYNKLTRIIALVILIPLACIFLLYLFYLILFAISIVGYR